MSELTQSQCWRDLQEQRHRLADFSLQEAFADQPGRAERFSLEAAGIYLDYAKNLIDDEALEKLLQLAQHCDVQHAIHKLHNGDIVNTSEQRPALHWLLRAGANISINPELKQSLADINTIKTRLKETSEKILTGALRGYTGKPFTDVVNIGIGGSDLGPAMTYQALYQEHQQGIHCHFVSNICAHDLLQTLENLDPQTTLFIVASKSFTTQETLQNAASAKSWLLETLQDEAAVASHFFAVTSKPEKAQTWGIKHDAVFPFREWVGGRYSVWSAIGLPLCIGLGYNAFEKLLAGAETMDNHFFDAPLEKNMPVLLALLGIWYNNFWQAHQQAMVPYDHRLRRFTAYLQQLEMESNGKSATVDNHTVDYATGPVIWGEPGTNGQHSFFQLLHQGTHLIPVDFVAVADGGHNCQEHQQWLLANCLAQSRALMLGQSLNNDPLAAQTFMPGNKPSNTLLLQRLTPETLGALIALYEHKVYTQSVIWGINAFDQWGVELGKMMSKEIRAIMDGDKSDGMDSSTLALLKRCQKK